MSIQRHYLQHQPRLSQQQAGCCQVLRLSVISPLHSYLCICCVHCTSAALHSSAHCPAHFLCLQLFCTAACLSRLLKRSTRWYTFGVLYPHGHRQILHTGHVVWQTKKHTILACSPPMQDLMAATSEDLVVCMLIRLACCRRPMQ